VIQKQLGIDVKRQEIVEISIIRMSDKVQLTKQIRADNPLNANADALELTGKTLEDLYIGVSKIEAIESIQAFLDEDGSSPKHRCLICHNAPFDMRFMHAMWTKANRPFPVDMWIDTMPMMRKFVKEAGINTKKLKLENSLKIVGCKTAPGKHNAKSDTRNLYYLYSELIKKYHYVDYIKNLPKDPYEQTETSEEEIQEDY